MKSSFEAPEVLAQLGTNTTQPWDMGKALGTMLCWIRPLVDNHMDHDASHPSEVPKTLAWAPAFVTRVDRYMAEHRLADGYTQAMRYDYAATTDRKTRRLRWDCVKRYTQQMERALKGQVRQQLADVFLAWDVEQTQLFNQGVDKGLGEAARWMVYPKINVVFQTEEEDWSAWLRKQCDALGMVECKAGRRALEG